MEVNERYNSGAAVTDAELKQSLLSIMDSIHHFCEENNIKYFLLGGTMLGAVRHKGFIPWDDDIDIGMLREDYEKFCACYSDSTNSYSLKSIYNDPKYYLPFAKVIDPRISLYEEVPNAPEIGAYIDVFPLDYIEKDSKNGSAFFEKNIRVVLEELRYLRTRKSRAVWKNLLILISRVLYPKTLNAIAIDREKRAKSVSCSKRTPWIANLHGAWKQKEIVPEEFFGQGAKYVFEGREYWGVENYDGYLTCLYRDYMTPPPPEKRVTHHGFVAKWK